jgi:hypothetical protein
MNLRIYFFAIAFIALPWTSQAQSDPKNNSPVNPFIGKFAATPNIHVEAPAQFVKWSGKPVPNGSYDVESFKRTRLGTIAFSPDLRVHIDAIENLIHFPAYYELIDSRSGRVLGTYDVFDPNDAYWYFSGNGTAYLNQTHLSLCGPRYTRKIEQKGKALVEVVQPLVYIGAETDVESTIQLFETPTSKKIVAAVLPGSKVTVLGLQPGNRNFFEMALLVKTPFGLTGWHVPRDALGDGRMSIYQCN